MPARFGTSAQFSRELLDASLVQGMEMARPRLSQLITTVSLGDNEGTEAKYVVTGNECEPRELFGKPIENFDRIGTYTFRIRPNTYGRSVILSDQEISDATMPIWLDKARASGAKVPYFLEKRLVNDVMVSSTLVDGFDGQPLYSASHTWRTSDTTPGDPAPAGDTTPQANIITAGSGGTDYASTTAVLDDFYQARAAMNSFTDDKGTSIDDEDGKYFIVYNNKTAGLDRWLNAAFNPNAQASDDSLRDGYRFQVTLIPTPHLPASAGSTDYDWYLFRIVPGQNAPLVLQVRQAIQSETYRDPKTKLNYYDYTIRYGFSWTNWWQTIHVNKS